MAEQRTTSASPLTDREVTTSDQRYRLMIQSHVAGFALHEIILDGSGVPCDYRFLEVNPAFERLTGLVASDLIGRTVLEVMPGTEQVWIERYGRVVQTGVSEHFASYSGVLDRHYEVTAYFAGPGRFAVMFLDITDRKRAEEELRESEERFRALVRASSDVVYRMSPDWSEMRQLRGRGFINDTEVPSRTWLQEYIHPDDQPLVMAVISEAIRTKSIFQLEHRVLRVDGSMGWTFSRAVPLLDANGDISEWFGAASDVTDRKRAEERLAAEKERLAVTLRCIGDAVIATDEAGRVTVFNGVAEELTGWKAGGAVGTSIHEVFNIINEDTRQPAVSPVDRVLREGIVVGLANHTALVARDGTERPIADSGAPIRDANGVISGVVLVFRDQTEERRAEQALRGSETRYRLLFQNMLDGFAYCRMLFDEHGHPEDFVYLDVNGAFGRLTGLHDVVGKKVSEVIPGIRESQPDLLETYGRVARTGQSERFEVAFRPLGIWLSISVYSPQQNHFVAVFDDITERKRAEEALRQTEERLRALADSMPQLAWTAQPDGYITWYNRRWYEYTGTTPRQMEGWGWQSVHDPVTLPDVLCRWRQSIATGTAFDMEFPLRGADGKFRRFLTRVFPLKSADGAVVQWFGTNTDVTALVEAQESLKEAARRKDEFLGMLSHELRNPLAPIRNSIYILEHADPTGQQAARARSVIQRQAEHLTRLVDDLLDVTRIARGKIQLRQSRVDLREVVWRAADDFGLMMHDRGIAFRTALRDEKLGADADATRITQVVGNLLHNAAKFTPRGGEVTLSLRAAGGEAEISVRDTGVGIDPALLPHVFEEFVQGERTLARTEGGLGLGLALVKGIAELHGGTVRAESAGKDRGAEFVVRLPLAVADVSRDAPPPAVERTNGGRRVLVVDDNHDAAESLAEIMKMLGHTVEVAYDGPSAIEKARVSPPDIVLCDIGLPGMSGYEVAKALRADGTNRMLLIAVSGYAQPEDVKEAVDAGFDGHVAKPCDPTQIERLIE